MFSVSFTHFLALALQYFLSLRKGGIKVLLQATYSTIMYPNYLGHPGISALTVVPFGENVSDEE